MSEVCASCGTSLASSAKFCRSCGTPVATQESQSSTTEKQTSGPPKCNACGSAIASSASFCRSCGAAVGSDQQTKTNLSSAEPPQQTTPSTTMDRAEPTHPDPDSSEVLPGCKVCGSPVLPGKDICKECATSANDKSPDEETIRLSAHSDSEATTSIPPPSARRAGVRSRVKWTGAVVAVVLTVGGAGLAAYLLLIKEGSSVSQNFVSGAEEAGTKNHSEPDSSDPEGATSDSRLDKRSSSEGGRDSGKSKGEGTKAHVDADSASPEEIMRTHWELITKGDYEGAFRLFHSSYRNRIGRRWVRIKEKQRPQIGLETMKFTQVGEPREDVVTMRADFVTADTAGKDANRCMHWTGSLRLQLVNGRWRYRPGPFDGMSEPTLDGTKIAASDSRCKSVL